jgi:folate-binding protein YgfZ
VLGNAAAADYFIAMTVWLEDRAVAGLSGPDAREFLQGLITNDVARIGPEAPSYAALLTAQGKILFDFLIVEQDGMLLLDCQASSREGLIKRLSLYRLRAKVEIVKRDDLAVIWQPDGSASLPFFRDPRRPDLGFRAIVPKDKDLPPAGAATYTKWRLAQGAPEGGDFGQDKVFALDAGLDELGAVAFDKGCYVGQELTARMKHRGTARKRLLPVLVDDERTALIPDAAVRADGHEIGTIHAVYGPQGFALLRLDRLADNADGPFDADGTSLHILKPAWLFA